MPESEPPSSDQSASANRRTFLHQTAAASVAAALLAPRAQAGEETKKSPAEHLLPTIALGPHRVTRLILGGNPIYGHSHFNRHLSRHLTDWHTPDRVQQLLRQCEAAGINAWQNSYAPRTLDDLDRYRRDGGRMHWLSLGKPNWDEHPEFVEEAARRKPIGIAPHGALAEKLHRQKKLDVLKGLLGRIRQTGVLVGLSAHNPELIELAEEQNWDVDYYMCCLYYMTRPAEEFQRILGPNLPLGEIYLPSDPPRMLQAVQRVRKPCLVYKILAAGRRINTPQEVRQSFETAFAGIKPTDGVIVGMYQQFSDQVGENAAIVREILRP
ncbi:MAG TPA: hypothetical protein VL475_05290 [Planctomycetaceae bacterium]|nr:hypothetical protein [Planctomycetaceae bacterium]